MVIYQKEEFMTLKILLGLVIGGVAGFALNYLTRSIGSSWALTCNPYIAIPLGAVVGLIVALG
jgi:L-cystine uptake protein TcyP (sodium:dicarboxylate symporter family)